MFFSSLKEIISHLKKTVTCPHCKKKYTEGSLELMYLQGARVAIVAHCASCATSTTVVVSEEAPKPRSISFKERKMEVNSKIEMDDVLDMKSFMKDFDGNFKDFMDKDK